MVNVNPLLTSVPTAGTAAHSPTTLTAAPISPSQPAGSASPLGAGVNADNFKQMMTMVLSLMSMMIQMLSSSTGAPAGSAGATAAPLPATTGSPAPTAGSAGATATPVSTVPVPSSAGSTVSPVAGLTAGIPAGSAGATAGTVAGNPTSITSGTAGTTVGSVLSNNCPNQGTTAGSTTTPVPTTTTTPTAGSTTATVPTTSTTPTTSTNNPGTLPPGRQDLSSIYLQSIDQQGNINHPLLDGYQNMGPNASKINMYEQYAKEFLLGKRDFNGAAQYAAIPLNMASKPGDLFAGVASVYRIEQGPTAYNEPALKDLLNSSGPRGQQLASQFGVGQYDVQTLSAVTEAINEGVISLNQIVDNGSGKYVTNPQLYQNVIQYVENGSFAQDTKNLEAGNYTAIPPRFNG